MGDDGFAWGFELERKVRKLLCPEAGVAQVNRGRLSQHTMGLQKEADTAQ